MWSDLTPITVLFTQMAPVTLSSSKAPSMFPLRGLCTYSSSAQLWCPQLSMWLDPPLSSHHCSQFISIWETFHDPPPPSPSPSPSSSPLPCFGCLHNICHHLIFYIFVSLVVIDLRHLECSFQDTRDSGCSVYCATLSLNCAKHRDTKCAQQGVT